MLEHYSGEVLEHLKKKLETAKILEGEYAGEIARRSIENFDETVKLLKFYNHIIHTNNIDSLFKWFQFCIIIF